MTAGSGDPGQVALRVPGATGACLPGSLALAISSVSAASPGYV